MPGFENYAVFEDGDIVNIRTGRVLKRGDNGCGSLHVSLVNDDGERKTVPVRKLVAAAYLPEKPTPRHVLTHTDGDYTNCGANNLEWVTRANLQWKFFRLEMGMDPHSQRIRIIETGETFHDILACADYLDGDAKWIHRATMNSNWEYKGYHFEYV